MLDKLPATAPAPIQREAPWSQNEGGPRANAAGASVTPKTKEAPGPCVVGPKAKEGPRAHSVGASMIPKRRPPRPY